MRKKQKMRKKDAFAVVYYCQEAFTTTVCSSISYKYYRILVDDNENLEDCEKILAVQSAFCMYILDGACFYLGLKYKDIPPFSKVLKNLNTDVITRTIFKKAVETLIDRMPSNALDKETLDNNAWIMNACKN